MPGKRSLMNVRPHSDDTPSYPLSRAPKKAKREESKKKRMYVLFFDARGAIYQHFVPKGTTINTETYIRILEKFEELHRVKRPERFGPNATVKWYFHQDNAPVRLSGRSSYRSVVLVLMSFLFLFRHTKVVIP